MKRFSFALDRVRRFRSEQASLEESRLRQLRGQLAELVTEKRGLELACAGSEQVVLGQASIEAGELQSLGAYRRHIGKIVRDIENRKRQCQAQVEPQRQRLITARRDAELLEQWKQKALQQWRLANEREQESLATELYLSQWTRRR